MIFQLFLVILISIRQSIEIQFQCPGPQQWNMRAISYCQSKLEYVCLWNSFELAYNEACIGPIEESGGYRIVQNINGNQDVEMCPLEYYQPENINFRTTQGDNCLYRKSLCSEVGQLIHINGISTADRTCRCDYTMGYAFISTKRKNPCYCVSSEEDCTCYRKECDEDKILSPDYQCIGRKEYHTHFNCSELYAIYMGSTTESSSRDSPTKHMPERLNYVAAGIVTVLFILMVIICWKLEQIYIYIGKPYAIKPPDDLMECVEGESCKFTCVVSKGTAKWFKDDNSNIKTEKDIIYINGKSYSAYTTTLTNMKKENQGIYQLKKDNCIICKTELRFKSQFRSDLKLVSAKCEECYKVELQCTTNGSNGTVTWKKDGVEINEPSRIVSENREEEHKLTIKDATVADSGNYTVCYGKAERSLDVKIKAQFRSDLKVVSAKCIEGCTVELHCTTNGGNGTVTWTKDGVKINESNRIVSEDQEEEHKLTIKHATVADSGNYTVFHGKAGRSLDVKIKAQFRSDLKVVSAKCVEGCKVELQCTTSGENDTVTWTKDGVEINEPNRIVIKNQEEEHTLTIKDATVADSGKYTVCHGKADRSLDLKIKAQFKTDLKLVSTKCIEGCTIELQCTTNGENGSVTWKKDGVEINEPSRIVSENQDEEHKLTIKDATVVDSGKYTVCQGKAERSLDVQIKGFIKTHLINTVIMEGLDVTLECEIEEEVEENIASVQWLKNGIKFEGSDNIKLESEGTVYMLIIVATELDHNGRYEIVINQKYTTAAKLDVKPLPIEIKQMPKENRDAFLSAARNGTTPNHSIRVMIVGKKNAGKTCLLRRLLDKDIDGVVSTDCLNIEIRKCQIDLQNGHWILSDIKSNLKSLEELADCGFWDFAGQKEYYASHQTFLTPNAIYILTVDMSEDLSQKTVQRMIEDDFDHVGGYINFWMDSIHCYARANQEINLQKTDEKIYPPVMIVGTCIDKLEHDTKLVENKKMEFNTHINELLDTQYKRQHIWEFHTLSNILSSYESEFKALRQQIYETAKKMPKWGESMPTRWILLEKELKQIADCDNKVIDFNTVVRLATEIKFQECDDNRELISFLQYEHHVGNVIFFDNIREFIILDHMWLVNALRCLVAPLEFQRESMDDSDWCDLSKTGKFSEKLLKRVFKAKNPSFVNKIDYVMKIMEEFDIVLKHDNSYYVPSLITSIKFADVLRDFHVNDDCIRTSWFCLEFRFLPPSFFNHILVRFTRKYKLSDIDSRPAMYKGVGVFDLQENRIEKLAMCVSKNSVALQVWTWGTDVSCYEAIRKFLVAEVQSIQKRYRINISYELKLKCPCGLYYKSSDKKDIFYWIRESSYKCSAECRKIHKSDDIYSKWYKLLPKTDRKSYGTYATEGTRYTCHVCDKEPSVGMYWCYDCQVFMCKNCYNKHRNSDDNYHHNVQLDLDRCHACDKEPSVNMYWCNDCQVSMCQSCYNTYRNSDTNYNHSVELVLDRCHVCHKKLSVYWCRDCKKSMCNDCIYHHRKSDDTSRHIVQHVQDTYSLDYNFKVDKNSINDIKMLNDKLLVIASYFCKELIIYHISEQQKQYTIPLPGSPRNIAVVDNNTVAVTLGAYVGLEPISVVIMDIEQRQIIQHINVNVGCAGIMYRNDHLFVGCDDNTIKIMTMSGEITRTIPVGVVPYYISGCVGGRIYYTDCDKLYCIDTSGNILFTFSSPDMSYPYGITANDDEHVLVIYNHSNNVIRISPDGKQRQIIITQIQSSSYRCPYIYYDSLSKSVVIGNYNNVYVYKKI